MAYLRDGLIFFLFLKEATSNAWYLQVWRRKEHNPLFPIQSPTTTAMKKLSDGKNTLKN